MESEEMVYKDEDEIVFTVKMDGDEILDLEQTFPYEQKQAKPFTAEDVWDTDSIEFLLLSYYQYIQSFRASQEEAERQWINISLRLSKTAESCKRQFELLQNKYFELARSQLQKDTNVLNAEDINWPYFDLFFKMYQYTPPAKSKLAHEADKLNIDLVQYYIKHKHLFMAAEFGGEMRLWSIFAKDGTIEPEECAYKIRFLRWNYLTLKAKVKEINSPNIEKMYLRRQEYRMWIAAFDPPTPERPVTRNVLQTRLQKSEEIKTQSRTPRKAKWRNDEIMSLIVFYSENIDSFKFSTSLRDLWKPLTDSVNRTTSDCQRKFGELTKKYEHFKEKLLEKPNAKIQWRYYTILDNLFTESDGERTLDVKNEMDFSENDYSTNNFAMLEENVTDDDTVCIIVASEEDNELYTNLSTTHSSTEEDKELCTNLSIAHPTTEESKELYTNLSTAHSSTEEDKELYTNPSTAHSSTKEDKELYTNLCTTHYSTEEDKELYTNLSTTHYSTEEDKELYTNLSTTHSSTEEDKELCTNLSIAHPTTEESKELYTNLSTAHSSTEEDKELYTNPSTAHSSTKEDKELYTNLCTTHYSTEEDKELYTNLSTTHYSTEEDKELYTNLSTTHYSTEEDKELYTNLSTTHYSTEEDKELYTKLSTGHPNTEDIVQQEVIEEMSLRWAKRAKIKLLNLYKEYIKRNRNQEINEVEMWTLIGTQMKRSPVQCRRRFNMLRSKYFKMLKVYKRGEKVDWPYFFTFGNVFRLKPFKKDPMVIMELERASVSQPIKTDKVLPMKVYQMLTYYLANVEEFVSPKYKKNNVWAGMGKAVGMGWHECRRTFAELQEKHRRLLRRGEANSSAQLEIFEQIWEKERQILTQLARDPTIAYYEEATEMVGFDVWDDSETLKLLEWYCSNLNRFKNRKYIHKYIWRETETALGLNPARCSKKMRDIRSAYRVKLLEMQGQETTECQWEYFDICKRIYGTDLDDPFLSKTKKAKQHIQLRRETLLKKRRRNKKVMSKETVERLVNYYLANYDLFRNPPNGVERHVWQDLASDIGFSNLACQKKLELLKRQYKDLLSIGDVKAVEKWRYTDLVRRVIEYSDCKEIL